MRVCVCVMMMMAMVVVGDEGGIVYSCPVARLVGTLASASPLYKASKRGPSIEYSLVVICLMMLAKTPHEICQKTYLWVNMSNQ